MKPSVDESVWSQNGQKTTVRELGQPSNRGGTDGEHRLRGIRRGPKETAAEGPHTRPAAPGTSRATGGELRGTRYPERLSPSAGCLCFLGPCRPRPRVVPSSPAAPVGRHQRNDSGLAGSAADLRKMAVTHIVPQWPLPLPWRPGQCVSGQPAWARPGARTRLSQGSGGGGRPVDSVAEPCACISQEQSDASHFPHVEAKGPPGPELLSRSWEGPRLTQAGPSARGLAHGGCSNGSPSTSGHEGAS
ncbi:uncharacterized protein LOC125159236 [Prionailurus viverrinus]|uniref:uncharacterized protein LOC125159236 n=1 Tax=Prionailurus viverrinus TaxID=61388 RepID=UPI001FF54FE0|nr:uncharacterized protein LOC125159236 [Prionailurus viverrinus]